MVEQQSDLDPVFKALADPSRRAIVAQLSSGPTTIGDIAAPLDMSFAGASKHVNILVEARLIRKRRDGRRQLCSLNPEPLAEVRDWLDTYARFWSHKLDALEGALKDHEQR